MPGDLEFYLIVLPALAILFGVPLVSAVREWRRERRDNSPNP